jgi:hypothetical protein
LRSPGIDRGNDMGRIGSAGLCLAAAFMLAGIVSASASAAVIAPEIGRCLRGIGYANSKCTVAGGNVGEWISGPGPRNGFFATGTASTLEALPSKNKVKCKAVAAHGVYKSATTEELSAVEFTGCVAVPTGAQCESSNANGNFTAGRITTFLLVGKFGLIQAPAKAGVDLEGLLSAGPPFVTDLLAHFECGATAQGNGTGTQLFVEGDVIGELLPTNKMTTTFKLKFAKIAATGQQKPENFVNPITLANEPNTHLITWLYAGGPPAVESSNEVANMVVVNEEPLELRTKN